MGLVFTEQKPQELFGESYHSFSKTFFKTSVGEVKSGLTEGKVLSYIKLDNEGANRNEPRINSESDVYLRLVSEEARVKLVVFQGSKLTSK